MSDRPKKEDMTRIEDLSEFLHSEDSEVDDLFIEENIDEGEAENEIVGPPDFEMSEELPPDFEEPEENSFGTDASFDYPTELSEPEFQEDVVEEPEVEYESAPEPEYEQDEAEIIQEVQDFEPIQETLHAETTPQETYRETYKEVVDFGNNISYGKVQSGGNPAFSVMMKGIENPEDHDSIIATLSEHGLVGSNENIIRQSLDLGILLIAQISEYSAIYLAGKLRKYCSEINVGLAEEIHKSKSYEKDNKGLVTKKSIFQNKDKKFNKKDQKFELEDMLITKSSNIPNTKIIEHIGVIATSKIYTLAELTSQTVEYQTEDDSTPKMEIGSKALYDELIRDLAIVAHDKGANAVLSVSHNMSALVEKDLYGDIQYQIICSGDAVIIDKM